MPIRRNGASTQARSNAVIGVTLGTGPPERRTVPRRNSRQARWVSSGALPSQAAVAAGEQHTAPPPAGPMGPYGRLRPELPACARTSAEPRLLRVSPARSSAPSRPQPQGGPGGILARRRSRRRGRPGCPGVARSRSRRARERSVRRPQCLEAGPPPCPPARAARVRPPVPGQAGPGGSGRIERGTAERRPHSRSERVRIQPVLPKRRPGAGSAGGRPSAPGLLRAMGRALQAAQSHRPSTRCFRSGPGPPIRAVASLGPSGPSLVLTPSSDGPEAPEDSGSTAAAV
ncbi:hypothetical protein FHS40_009158 [Streptomyces spectabilis]|uniref:Uncharacterized protein n=1 Tax=Streptomyces spectabilis TaxID=68270 RepID=A0A7W8B479_STRST|nr:hypothetical protein [Streptomyces spectabilis]